MRSEWQNEYKDSSTHRQSATLIELLDSWGIDLRDGASAPVRVLRHAGDDGAPHRFYDLGSEEFEWYQGCQKTRIFGDARILVSFIKTEGYEANFIGVYHVHGLEEGRVDPAFAADLPKDMSDKCNCRYHYRLARDTDFDQFRGGIRIEWDKVESRWVRQHEDANRRIVAIKGISGEWLAPEGRGSLLQLGIMPGEDESPSYDFDIYKEGGRNLRSHFTIERNGALIRDSKARFKKLHGRLFCQACGFDFLNVYGEDYIECHHTIPVHRLPSNGFTSIDDVAFLCSNCHRMIHRRKEWISVDELRSLLDSRRP